MRSIFRNLLVALPLVGSVVGEGLYRDAHEAFRDLINAIPEESLHAALNSLSHFKDGVFESDRRGVERVHNDNPPLATKLIVAAVQDLKNKRQTPNNGTSSQPPPPPSSNPPPPPPPSSSRDPGVIVPVPVTTTDGNGQATVVSSAILSEPTASIAVPVTRTNGNGQTQVVQETKPAVIFTATNAQGSAFVTTSAVDFAPTPGQVLTRTNEQGGTFLTTYTPGGGTVSSILLITTTGEDGQPRTITSYTFVEPGAAETGTPPSGTQSGRPGLQTAAAHKNRAMEAAVLGGAVGGVFAMFL